MPKGHSSAYKDVHHVWVVRNIGKDEILRGARNNDSPFFMREVYAIRKCKKLNEKLSQYSSTKYGDKYKVTRYKLERLDDIFVSEDDSNTNQDTKDKYENNISIKDINNSSRDNKDWFF